MAPTNLLDQPLRNAARSPLVALRDLRALRNRPGNCQRLSGGAIDGGDVAEDGRVEMARKRMLQEHGFSVTDVLIEI